MKNLYSLALLTTLLFAVPIYSQEIESLEIADTVKDNYKIRHDRLKELYIKMLDSESNKKATKLRKAYVAKTNHLKYKDEVRPHIHDITKWVNANIEKTEFKSVEEATTMFNEVAVLELANLKENDEYMYYLAFTTANPKYKNLVAEIILEVMREYPEKAGIPKEVAERL